MISINQDIKAANQFLMTSWPLASFIATNPLWQYRNESFFEAVQSASFSALMPTRYYYQHYQAGDIDEQHLKNAYEKMHGAEPDEATFKKWIEDSLDETIGERPAVLYAQQCAEYEFQRPVIWIRDRLYSLLRNYFSNQHYKDRNFLSAWQLHCKPPSEFHVYSNSKIPERIGIMLDELTIKREDRIPYLKAIYCQIYGWASMMNWRNQHPDNPWLPGSDPSEGLLVAWLSYEVMMHRILKQPYKKPNLTPCQTSHQNRCIWQTAFEYTHQDRLLDLLKSPSSPCEKAKAQFIFCIDTRSEGFRRQLEHQGALETFGFAGFFGAIFKLECDGNIAYQSPALVQPSRSFKAHRNLGSLGKFLLRCKTVFASAKRQLTAPFALFEMMGVWFLFFMLYKTFQGNFSQLHNSQAVEIESTFTESEQVDAALNLLKSIGLTKHFSDWVFICAHQSDNVNNPFSASLNCGACGGNSGVPNAIVMSQILNDQAIRAHLKEKGIRIPDSTRFVPACHHTVYDRLEILEGTIPAELTAMIEQAAANLREEKCQALPGVNPLSIREATWSELIPELGLINNSAILIAPRALSRGIDLGRRVFLHSYEPACDDDAAILSGILSAPAVVAHWISAQYFFSTTDPTQFGAGNKAIHNVMPGVGVLEGNLSDLKIGLPQQSTYFQAQAIHEPRRLIVIVQAKQSILEKAIAASPDFKALLDNQWIKLVHIEAGSS